MMSTVVNFQKYLWDFFMKEFLAKTHLLHCMNISSILFSDVFSDSVSVILTAVPTAAIRLFVSALTNNFPTVLVMIIFFTLVLNYFDGYTILLLLIT